MTMTTKRKPAAAKEVVLTLTNADLTRVKGKWKEATNSIDSVQINNLVAFLSAKERIHFANELHRVLKSGGKAQIATPHWCSARAYGDLAFQWPPVSEAWFYHLNDGWRKANAPWGKDYKCDFDMTLGYGMHPQLVSKNQEYQQHAMTFWKEAAQDIIICLIKK